MSTLPLPLLMIIATVMICIFFLSKVSDPMMISYYYIHTVMN